MRSEFHHCVGQEPGYRRLTRKLIIRKHKQQKETVLLKVWKGKEEEKIFGRGWRT